MLSWNWCQCNKKKHLFWWRQPSCRIEWYRIGSDPGADEYRRIRRVFCVGRNRKKPCRCWGRLSECEIKGGPHGWKHHQLYVSACNYFGDGVALARQHRLIDGARSFDQDGVAVKLAALAGIDANDVSGNQLSRQDLLNCSHKLCSNFNLCYL